MFLPQAIAAIFAALAGARLTLQLGVKRMFVAGLVGDLAAMSLLVASQFFIGEGALPYAMLLLATTSLGIGFGLTVPALNTFAAAFFPAAADRAVLYLNIWASGPRWRRSWSRSSSVSACGGGCRSSSRC